jgi:hypothetical protein
MVGRVGVEPTSPVFQTGAVTTLATAPQWSNYYLERETGFEPAASSLARRRSTAELFPQQTKTNYNKDFPIFIIDNEVSMWENQLNLVIILKETYERTNPKYG